MTDTTSTEIKATETDLPVGVLEHLDPHSLTLEVNVRDEAGLDCPTCIVRLKISGPSGATGRPAAVFSAAKASSRPDS